MRRAGPVLAAAFAGLIAAPATAQQEDDLRTFVLGNTLHIMLHEIGHLLIDELNLPVLGQEEDAADNFATLTLIEWDTDEADQALADTAFGWLVRHDESVDFSDGDFFTEHDLDAQRAYRIICHLVGTDTDAYSDLALNLGLDISADAIAECDYAFALSARSWKRVLAPHLPSASTGNTISVRYEEGDGELGFFADMLQSDGMLEHLRAFINESVVLPGAVAFEARACGIANAFYDPRTQTVSMCYELMDEIATIYEIATGG